jgi:hypothetical protein
VRHNGRVTEALHHKTLIRCSDEPKLEIGDLASIREGVVGVELRPETGKRAPMKMNGRDCFDSQTIPVEGAAL